MPRKPNWQLVENRIREILRNDLLQPEEALACIDAVLAAETGRGRELPENEHLDDRLANCYPRLFPL